MSEEDQHNILPFEEAVKIAKVVEIPTESTPEAVESLKERLSKTNLMLFGEIHGVKENPDVIYTLMKRFGFQGLALEWHKDLTGMIDDFLASGKLDMDKLDKSEDGRITAGHFALLQRLQQESMLKRLILFDGDFPGTWNGRDKAMADRILSQRDRSISTLVVAGNLHTQTGVIKMAGHPDITHPMGFHILSDESSTPAGKIIYFSGEFYNLGIKNFNELYGPNGNYYGDSKLETDKVRFILDKDETFFYTLPVASLAIVP